MWEDAADPVRSGITRRGAVFVMFRAGDRNTAAAIAAFFWSQQDGNGNSLLFADQTVLLKANMFRHIGLHFHRINC